MYKFFVVASLLIATGCASTTIDLAKFQQTGDDSGAVSVPDECMHLYRPDTWEIAVVEFANNTGYRNDIDINNTSTSGAALAATTSRTTGVAVGNSNIAIGASRTNSLTGMVYSEDSTTFMTQFAPSLGTFAQSTVEEAISQIGGIKLYSRAALEQILAEQQFQMSIADPDTVMEFGKLSGVKYILTGSVDNIAASYIQPTNMRSSESELATALSFISIIKDVATSGWYVAVSITLTLVDAETGEVIFSQSFEKEERATQSTNFQPDIIINSAKAMIIESLEESNNYIADHFAIAGYINSTKGGRKIAQLNLGDDAGVKEGDEFTVYRLSVVTDFLTRANHCSLEETGATVTISNQIDEKFSWGVVEADDHEVELIKAGAYVKRTNIAPRD